MKSGKLSREYMKKMMLDALSEYQKVSDEKFNSYYTVSLTFPFIDKVFRVGCFHDQDLAKIIRGMISEALNNEPAIKKTGGFNLRIDGQKGKIFKSPAGLQLENSDCGIEMVEEKFTFELIKKIAEYVPSILPEVLNLRQKLEETTPIESEIYRFIHR